MNAKYSIQHASAMNTAAQIKAPAMPGFSLYALLNCELEHAEHGQRGHQRQHGADRRIALMKSVVIATAIAIAPCSSTDHSGGLSSLPAKIDGR